MQKPSLISNQTGVQRFSDSKDDNIALASVSRGGPFSCLRLTGRVARNGYTVSAVSPINQAGAVKAVGGRGFSVGVLDAVLGHRRF